MQFARTCSHDPAVLNAIWIQTNANMGHQTQTLPFIRVADLCKTSLWARGCTCPRTRIFFNDTIPKPNALQPRTPRTLEDPFFPNWSEKQPPSRAAGSIMKPGGLAAANLEMEENLLTPILKRVTVTRSWNSSPRSRERAKGRQCPQAAKCWSFN